MTKEEALQKIDELKKFIEREEEKTEVEKLHDSFGHFERFGVKSSVSGQYILIPLPDANHDWTFAAWDYAKRLFNSADGIVFPRHNIDGYEKFVVIDCVYLTT